MREPASRAWSHARHNFREQEATFRGFSGRLDEVTDEKWIECLTDDWNRLSGDYLGQLQRWLSVFPREQVYLGFFEEIVHSPRRLLREILEFLELDPSFADSERVILERVNVGLPRDIPARVRQCLTAIHADRTRSLAEYLHDEHGMTVPLEWAETLAPANHSEIGPSGPLSIGAWEVDDDALAKLLCRDEMLERDFLGYNILRRDTSFVAYPMALGIVHPEQYGPQWWSEQLAAGTCLAAANPYDLKSLIVRTSLARDVAGSEVARLRHLEQQLAQVENQQSVVQASLGNIAAQLHGLEHNQADSNRHFAILGETRTEIAERVNSLQSAQTQILNELASSRLEHQRLVDIFATFDRAHRELVEYAQELRRSNNDLTQTCDDLLRNQAELLRSRDELIRDREETHDKLRQSKARLQQTEVTLCGVQDRVAALENSLVFRILRRIDRWLISLRLVKRHRPIDETQFASIDVPNGDWARNGHNDGKRRQQTPVAEKEPF